MTPPAATLPNELLEALGIHSSTVAEIATALALLGMVGGGLAWVAKLLLGLVKRLRAKRSDPDYASKLNYRRLFARHVASRIADLDTKEEWADHRFAELEAEVEIEGADGLGARRRLARLLGRSSGLRRERSLTKALSASDDALILLQGDPGSGKSVALRYVARRMAETAEKAKTLDAVIPLYINLKAMDAAPEDVDAERIRQFVLARLTDGADRDVHRFLDAQFADGVRNGTWLFLFDSFDEIPAVLSATDADETVQRYSDAIVAFMHGMNRCRGVIASRAFRSPARRDLPRYRIVPLNAKRRAELVDKANLAPAERAVIATLPAATPDLVTLTGNPMFLGLLCDYVRGRQDLPAGWHQVFEAYVSRRLVDDAERIRQLFHIEPEALRRRSEELAFTMSASPRLGLIPTRQQLVDAYNTMGFSRAAEVERAIDALVWSKLGKAEDGGASAQTATFTFAHRRFQEYFATNVVLREPDRVSAHTLLTDGAWRETAVTLAQAQSDRAGDMIAEAERLIAASATAPSSDEPFSWPPGLLHLLNLLQSGFAGRANRLPEELQRAIGEILSSAFSRGTIMDRKWALEVAGTADPATLASLLREAFQSRSDWLREVASRQVARLGQIPPDLARDIREGLILSLADGTLSRDWPGSRAQLLRLQPAAPFVRTGQLLRLVPVIDMAALAATAVYLVADADQLSPGLLAGTGALTALAHLSLRPVVGAFAMARPMASTRASREQPSRLHTAMREFERLAAAVTPRTTFVGLVATLAGISSRYFLAFLLSSGAAGSASVFLISLALLFWAPISAIGLRMGPAPPSWAWPSTPLLAVARVLRNMSKLPLFVIAIMLAWLGGAIAFNLLLILVKHVLGSFVDVLGWVAIGASVLWMARTLGVGFYREVADRRWHRRWREALGPTLATDELATLLTTPRSDTVARRLVRDIRKRRLLHEVPGAEGAVRAVLDHVESPADDAPRGADEALAIRLRRYAGTPVHDELGRLLEAVQAAAELPTA